MKRYPEEVEAFIRNNVVGTTTKKLAEIVNAEFGTEFTESKMKSYKSNKKLKSGTPCGLPAERPTEMYPEEVQRFIDENIAGTEIQKMAEMLNDIFDKKYTPAQIKGYCRNKKLKNGLDSKFKKGGKSWNKGLKGIMTGGAETQFKKGNKPYNCLPIGTERVGGTGYVEIKIKDGEKQNNWKPKHILMWEEHNGPVPKGYVVIFGDRDKLNITLNNLILVSRGQLAILNRKKLIQNDSELTRTAIIITDIYKAIREKKEKK